ncbi:MAG: RloB domain-containing protein [Pedobacter sp.]|nr:MAG: RloB domain-containing protein [Pedobacter sp.]
MRKIKPLAKTLLIVCEGASTEPKYFEALAAISLDKDLYSNIEVYPAPKKPESAAEREKARNKNRATRKFSGGTKKVSERTVEPADQDELAFVNTKKGVESWPQPVRYIKEARDRVKEAGYNEAWAVFDMDGHARPADAYQLADIEVEEIKINIAFSSISFEHWILLHFEQNSYPFKKSQCKDHETEDSKECGTGAHPEDCLGKHCVSGYMIRSHYIPNYDKADPIKLFEQLLPKTSTAIENAAWLRATQTPYFVKRNIWQVNPYTDVDQLVKRLLGIETNNFALVPGVTLDIENLKFTIVANGQAQHLEIKNQTGSTIINKQFTMRHGEETIPQPEDQILEHQKTLTWILPAAAGETLYLQFSDNIISLHLPPVKN